MKSLSEFTDYNTLGGLKGDLNTEPVQPTVVIESTGNWEKLRLRELWAFRRLISALVARDVRTRYRQTALGPLWLIISPFVNLVVMSIIFGQVAKLPSEGLPYPIFLFVAMLPWNLFGIGVTACTNSLGGFMGWMSKIYFPPMVAPIVSVVTATVDWAISLLILVGLMIYYGFTPSLTGFYAPLYLAAALLGGVGIGLWGAALAVWFRDFTKILSYALSVLYYATPVLYSSAVVPEEWMWLYKLNPMYWVVEGFRWSLLGKGNAPQVEMILPGVVFLVILVSGAFVFQRTSRGVVDVL